VNSRTLQVLEFSRKQSTTFHEVWEPRGQCHIAGNPQTSWEHWKQNNLPLDKVRQGAREKACGWSTRCLDTALTQTLSFDWLTIDWLDGWLFNTQINVSLTKLASHISPCQMYVQGAPKSGTLLVFDFPPHQVHCKLQFAILIYLHIIVIKWRHNYVVWVFRCKQVVFWCIFQVIWRYTYVEWRTWKSVSLSGPPCIFFRIPFWPHM